MNEKFKPQFDLIDFKVVWSDVNDILPEYGIDVLVLVIGQTTLQIPSIKVCTRISTDVTGEHWEYKYNVVAWAPLPEIPGELRKSIKKSWNE